MAVTPYVFDGAVLTGSAAQQGTSVPVLTTRVIKAAVATNPTGAPIALTAYLVPSGGTAGGTNVFISAKPVAAGDSYPCPELIGQGLNAGGFVSASGNGLVFKYTATDFV